MVARVEVAKHDWFTARERTFLGVLERNYNALVRHAKDHKKLYTRYIEGARQIHVYAGATRPQTRALILVASEMALMLDAEMQRLLALHDAETPLSRPKTLTQALSPLKLHVIPFGPITQVQLKALFLLMAGLYTKSI